MVNYPFPFKFSSHGFCTTLFFSWIFFDFSDLFFTNSFPLSCPLNIHVLRFLPVALFSLNVFPNDRAGVKYLSHLMYNSSFNKYLFSSVSGAILDPGKTGVSKNHIVPSLSPSLLTRQRATAGTY